MHFIPPSMFFLAAKFYALRCMHNKVIANENWDGSVFCDTAYNVAHLQGAGRIKRHHDVIHIADDNPTLSMLTLSEDGGGLVRSTITILPVTHCQTDIQCLSTLSLLCTCPSGTRPAHQALLLFFKASLHKFVV